MPDVRRLDDLTLSREELDAQFGAPLPTKTAMSSIDITIGFPVDNLAIPINLATAVNNASPESWAIADADQVVIVDQFDDDGMAPPPGDNT